MTLHSTVLIPMVLLLGATVPCLAEEASKQSFTCTAKTFNDCLMEARLETVRSEGLQARNQNHLPR
jgi:hypothetical protein